jgi:hypothetical protein
MPLQGAAEKGQSDVLALFMKRKVDRMTILAEVIQAAAMNEDHGEQMVALFSIMVGVGSRSKSQFFIAAAGNHAHGGAITSRLLDRGWGMRVSQRLRKKPASKVRDPVSPLLTMAPHVGAPIITEEVIKAAVKDRGIGTAIMVKLLDQIGFEMQLDDENVEEMCSNLEPSAVQLILGQNNSQIPLMIGLIRAAERNPLLMICWPFSWINAIHMKSRTTQAVIKSAKAQPLSLSLGS